MKKLLLVLIFSCANLFYLIAQPPSIEWQKCLGGSSHDWAYSIRQTYDNGYIVAGVTRSINGDVTSNHGVADCWLVKLNNTGTIEWQKTLGGTLEDWARSIALTSDSGYIMAGYSSSNNGDVTTNHGWADYWVVKLSSTGIIQWQKSLGGSQDEQAYSIQQTKDKGYIVAGYSSSNDGDVTGNLGGDYWVVKLDSVGNIVWQKSLGGTEGDKAWSVEQTTDGGYIIAGQTYSSDGDVTGSHGDLDAWIVKLKSTGTIDWQKSLGGTLLDGANSIQQTSDDGFIIGGYSRSIDGDATANHGSIDYWVVKLDSTGTLVWQKSLGGALADGVYSIRQTNDGGYIVAGNSESADGDATFNHGFEEPDYWIVKLSSTGIIEWQKSYGGLYEDDPFSIEQTTDGGYIIAGQAYSNEYDVSGNHSFNTGDFWIVKLSPPLGINPLDNSVINFQVTPNPVSNLANISFSLLKPGNISIKIYDLTGRVINTLFDGYSNSGSHQIIWDIDNGNIETGIYFLNLSGDGFSHSYKLVVVK